MPTFQSEKEFLKLCVTQFIPGLAILGGVAGAIGSGVGETSVNGLNTLVPSAITGAIKGVVAASLAASITYAGFAIPHTLYKTINESMDQDSRFIPKTSFMTVVAASGIAKGTEYMQQNGFSPLSVAVGMGLSIAGILAGPTYSYLEARREKRDEYESIIQFAHQNKDSILLNSGNTPEAIQELSDKLANVDFIPKPREPQQVNVVKEF